MASIFEELGVRDLMLGLQSDTLEGTLERMERFTAKVKPLTYWTLDKDA